MKWIFWALLLMLQNFAGTLNSRAKNGDNYVLHAWTAVLNNGVWFISNFILAANALSALKNADWGAAVFTGLFYAVFTSIGALLSQYVSINYLEKSK